jgi:cytochrome c oxidase assembly protein subunit 15
MQAMNALERRLRTVRRLAWACALLVLVITSLSAAIRLTRAGLGCAPWPQCRIERAQLAPQALDALESQGAAAARIAHRFAASAALLLVIALLMKTWAQQPPLRAHTT